jgi:hypothetical protein
VSGAIDCHNTHSAETRKPAPWQLNVAREDGEPLQRGAVGQAGDVFGRLSGRVGLAPDAHAHLGRRR